MATMKYLSYAPSDGVMHALGLEVIPVPSKEGFRAVLERLRRQGSQLIYVSEEIYQDHELLIRSYDQTFDVIISVLARKKERQSLGLERLNQLMKDAIGVSFEGRSENDR